MAIRFRYSLLPALLVASTAWAGGPNNGKTYTNFGVDLVAPIFPIHEGLKIYKNKFDTQALVTLKDKPVFDQRDERRPCTKTASDGWAYCSVGSISGWVKHSDFRTSAEYAPIASWPFRYWLYIASPGTGSEDAVMLRQIVPQVPYLVAPAEYANIFFCVIFDAQGRAFSARNRQPTRDRVFLIDDAVYLAPGNRISAIARNGFSLPTTTSNSTRSARHVTRTAVSVRSISRRTGQVSKQCMKSHRTDSGEKTMTRHGMAVVRWHLPAIPMRCNH